jgi:hypothetical protein
MDARSVETRFTGETAETEPQVDSQANQPQ